MNYTNEGLVVKQNIKDIVSLPEWQVIRANLVGKWKKQPDFCLNELKRFMTDINTLSNRRLRILQNYVTGSAFRIGIIQFKELDEFINVVKSEVQRRKENNLWL